MRTNILSEDNMINEKNDMSRKIIWKENEH